jgi:hypothetical protein
MSKKNRFFKRSAARQSAVGCDNAGNPIRPAPLSGETELRDENGRVFAEIGTMEPEIQAALDRILKDIPVPGGDASE